MRKRTLLFSFLFFFLNNSVIAKDLSYYLISQAGIVVLTGISHQAPRSIGYTYVASVPFQFFYKDSLAANLTRSIGILGLGGHNISMPEDNQLTEDDDRVKNGLDREYVSRETIALHNFVALQVIFITSEIISYYTYNPGNASNIYPGIDLVNSEYSLNFTYSF